MNLLHLKYAVEIAEANSMTKAAERLYTAQPNLSRAMRELESSLGIAIFKRTSKGIYPTAEGEEFLGYARKILAEVETVEARYHAAQTPHQTFSISVPRASYIACAFTDFVAQLSRAEAAEITYKETNAFRAISNIVNADYRLGILRYQTAYEPYFQEMLREKGLTSTLLAEFQYVLLMGQSHPLADKAVIGLDDLTPFVEIAHADPFVPTLPLATVRANELVNQVDKHIYVFERGSQMDILSTVPDTFMWVSPVPEKLLTRYGLVERVCKAHTKKYRDVLIYKKEYHLSALDKLFVDQLSRYQRQMRQSMEQAWQL